MTFEKQISSLKEQLASRLVAMDDQLKATGDEEVAQLRSKVDKLQQENRELREAIERHEPVVGVARVESTTSERIPLDSIRAENQQMKEKVTKNIV